VVSGSGNASGWLTKFQPQYEAKLGMKIFPGSLNLELDHEYSLLQNKRTLITFLSHEYGGERDIYLQPCKILGRKAFIWRTKNAEEMPERTTWSRNIIEIVTDTKLRETHGLKDGDVVQVSLVDE